VLAFNRFRVTFVRRSITPPQRGCTSEKGK
jgi:hypothetical protein